MKIKLLSHILLLFLSINLFSQSAPKDEVKQPETPKTKSTLSTDKSKTALSTDKSKTAASTDKSKTALSTDKSKTASSTDKSKVASSTDKSKTASSADKSKTASSAGKSKTASSADKSKTASSTDKSKTASSTDKSKTTSSTDKEENAQNKVDSARRAYIADSTAKAGADLTTGTESRFNFINILPYAIIVLIVSLFGFMYSRKQNEVEKLEEELKQIKHSGTYQTENFTTRVSKLEDDLKKSNAEIESLQDELKAERKRSAQLQSSQTVSEVPLEVVVPVNKYVSPIKYARYADLGDGFTASELLNEEDSETIFEITIISPNSATYRISSNPNAQKFALSNTSYFLGKTCKYDSSPTGGGIKNELPGDLKLQGNKWLIINAAKISFS